MVTLESKSWLNWKNKCPFIGILIMSNSPLLVIRGSLKYYEVPLSFGFNHLLDSKAEICQIFAMFFFFNLRHQKVTLKSTYF